MEKGTKFTGGGVIKLYPTLLNVPALISQRIFFKQNDLFYFRYNILQSFNLNIIKRRILM